MTGIYLTTVAAVDVYYTYSDNYCLSKYVWLTTPYCGALGVLSTIGSQISLFSMVALSTARYLCAGTLVPIDASSKTSRFTLLFTTLIIFLSSLLIALIPLLPTYEDFFVNGLYYHGVPLFTGIVDKQKHIDILKPYHGRFKTVSISWENIRNLVKSMFTD